MKVAVIGRTRMLLDTARLFAQKGHKIVLVATAKAAPEYTANEEDFAQFASENGAVFLNGAKLAPHINAIRDAGADIAISMNWPAVLDGDILGLFPRGVLNAHPGDLPRYRGNACPNWAMLNGEANVVLTIHQMAAGELDSGDILLKSAIPLSDDTTIGQVYQTLEERMPALYLQAAEGLLDGTIIPQPQSTDPADILRVYPRLPQDSRIDWHQPAANISRLVRASSQPFGGAYTWYKGKKLVVWAAKPGQYTVPSQAAPGQVVAIDRQAGTVSVAAGDGFVTLQDVLYEETDYACPSKLLSSMRIRLGMDAEEELALLRKELEALREETRALPGRTPNDGE